MAFDIRPLGQADLAAALENLGRYFLQPPLPSTDVARVGSHWDLDRHLGAFDGDRLVGLAGALPFRTTIPGGEVATMGLSRVGVVTTHRRRGLLRALLAEQFADALRRGEVVSSLRASQSAIYGRFGYGLAGSTARYQLATAHAAFARPLDDPGSVRLLAAEEVAAVLPPLYDEIGRGRVGAIDRPPFYWARELADYLAEPRTAPRWAAVHLTTEGRPDGYVDYRRLPPAPGGPTSEIDARVEVMGLWAADPTAYAALWRLVVDQDLVGTVEAGQRPLDEPLRHLLADPRRLRTLEVTDEQWVRLLDVGAALAARRYGTDERLALAVQDATLVANSGTWVVGGGQVSRDDDAQPDVRLDVSALGAAYLGGTSFAELAAAGRLGRPSVGVVARADRLFAVRPLPWCGTFF